MAKRLQVIFVFFDGDFSKGQFFGSVKGLYSHEGDEEYLGIGYKSLLNYFTKCERELLAQHGELITKEAKQNFIEQNTITYQNKKCTIIKGYLFTMPKAGSETIEEEHQRVFHENLNAWKENIKQRSAERMAKAKADKAQKRIAQKNKKTDE